MSNVATSRLLAHEEAEALFKDTATGLAKATTQTQKGVQEFNTEKEEHRGYLVIVEERIKLSTKLFDGVIEDRNKPCIFLDTTCKDNAVSVKRDVDCIIEALEFKPFDAVADLLPACVLQAELVALKKITSDDELKLEHAMLLATIPLYTELASGLSVAMQDVHQAKKERDTCAKVASVKAKKASQQTRQGAAEADRAGSCGDSGQEC